MLKYFFLLFAFFVFHALNAQQYEYKLSPQLKNSLRERASDSILVSISTIGIDDLKNHKKFRYLYSPLPAVRVVKIRLTDLPEIITLPEVLFINESRKAKEELTTGTYDLGLNKINYVQTHFPFVSGDSIRISVKERLFDTTDIDLRKRIFYTGIEPTFQTAHASLMATIISGGANSSPFAQGVADRSLVTSSGFQNLFADPDSVIHLHNISVQNHSYGTIIENFYGNEAMSYDLQSNAFPSLVHIFSSGNSGLETSSDGIYAGIPQQANLTGNFKQAKNVITVGSTDSAGQAMPMSSKGPAYDGRIRPELMAYGEDGSSGAAAIVSGVVALLQDAYKKEHGELPPSSLVRSVLVNSAQDMGNPYPDYNTGFGSVDAFRATQTIKESRFLKGVINNNDIYEFQINVPAGLSGLKVSLAWNDPAALPNQNKALINDLDIQVVAPSTQIWLPWVLDHSPSAVSLNAIAQRKTDTLNNIEQVSLDDPAAGIYTVRILANDISTPSQEFSVAWQFDTTGILYWTYPTNNDKLIAGNTHWLRWETNRQGPVDIEYATNGNNWRQAGTVANASLEYLKWQVPDTVTTAVLRIIHAGEEIISDSFTISPQIPLQLGFNCADSFLLYWNRLANPPYELYHIQDKYLQSFQTTNDTNVILNKSNHPEIYYSVAPLINGKPGIRSNTLNYPALGTACYFNAFYLQSQTAFDATFTVDLGTLFGVASLTLEKITSAGSLDLQTITGLTSTNFTINDSNLTSGENHYRLRLQLVNGAVYFSNMEVVYHWTSSPVIVYPVPARLGQPVRVVANESGRYTLKLFDMQGRLVIDQLLTSTVTEFLPAFYQKGLYLARIIDREGGSFTQKILVH